MKTQAANEIPKPAFRGDDFLQLTTDRDRAALRFNSPTNRIVTLERIEGVVAKYSSPLIPAGLKKKYNPLS